MISVRSIIDLPGNLTGCRSVRGPSLLKYCSQLSQSITVILNRIAMIGDLSSGFVVRRNVSVPTLPNEIYFKYHPCRFYAINVLDIRKQYVRYPSFLFFGGGVGWLPSEISNGVFLHAVIEFPNTGCSFWIIELCVLLTSYIGICMWHTCANDFGVILLVLLPYYHSSL